MGWLYIYISRYDWVGKVIHWELCKKFKFDHTNKWHMYNPPSVLENEIHKLSESNIILILNAGIKNSQMSKIITTIIMMIIIKKKNNSSLFSHFSESLRTEVIILDFLKN